MPRNRAPRPPANPAAVSPPGALSQRTDGGPGSATQPLRVASGQPFGQRQALEEAQRAAPLPDALSEEGGRNPQQAAAPPLPPVSDTLFAPSGVPGPGGPAQPNSFIPPDPDLLLKVIYQSYPHPEIRRLVNDIAR